MILTHEETKLQLFANNMFIYTYVSQEFKKINGIN